MLHLLNKEQFDLLVKTDLSLTLHSGLNFYNVEKEVDGKKLVTGIPAIFVSTLLRNFLVPVELLNRHYSPEQNCFQFLKGNNWLSNYSENSFEYCRLEGQENMIKSFEETLKTYKEDLENNPTSIFHIGRVKNLEEKILELKSQAL